MLTFLKWQLGEVPTKPRSKNCPSSVVNFNQKTGASCTLLHWANQFFQRFHIFLLKTMINQDLKHQKRKNECFKRVVITLQ